MKEQIKKQTIVLEVKRRRVTSFEELLKQVATYMDVAENAERDLVLFDRKLSKT